MPATPGAPPASGGGGLEAIRSATDALLGKANSIREALVESIDEARAFREQHKQHHRQRAALEPTRRVAVSGERGMDSTNSDVFLSVPKDEHTATFLTQALRSNSLFEEMPAAEIQDVVDTMDQEHVDRGGVILKRGDAGDKLYVIESGVASVRLPTDEGVTISTLGAGATFGELSVLYDSPRSATVLAEAPCELWTLSRAVLRRMLAASSASSSARLGQWLRRVPLLEKLTSPEVARLATALRRVEFSPGEVIIRQGDEGDAFYLVQSGTAVVTAANGYELGRLGQSEHFGEQALLNDAPRLATVSVAKRADREDEQDDDSAHNASAHAAPLVCYTLDRASFSAMLGPLVERMHAAVHERALASIQPLADLTPAQRDPIASCFKIVSCAKGDRPAVEGDPMTDFIAIGSGCLHELKYSTVLGADVELGRFARGTHFAQDVLTDALADSSSDAGSPNAHAVPAELRRHGSSFEVLSDGAELLVARGSSIREALRAARAAAAQEALEKSAPPARSPFEVAVPAPRGAGADEDGAAGAGAGAGAGEDDTCRLSELWTHGTLEPVSDYASRHLATTPAAADGRLCELKLWRQAAADDDGLRTQHSRELAALRALRGAPFVSALACAVEDDHGAVVGTMLEVCRGGDLWSLLYGPERALLPRGKFGGVSGTAALAYLANAVAALTHVHARGYAYRALVPETMLVGADGRLVLSDFSQAKLLVLEGDDETPTFTMCGVCEYMAPEAVLGQGNGRSADLWALGVLAYELYCGASPFAAASTATVLSNIIHAKSKLRFPIGLGADPKDLVRRLCNKSPVLRIGRLNGGMRELGAHRSFADTDWGAVFAREPEHPMPYGAGRFGYADESTDALRLVAGEGSSGG